MENKIKYLIYLRKSTDSEDRQIQSIEDQRKALEGLAAQLHLEIKGVYQENRSAKAPGRVEFNKMLDEIRKGKASGILCWKINRLARNPIDGGEIQWLLQQGHLRSIQTPGREYKTGDNVMMMSVEIGMANQYIIDLGRDVSRGMLSKVEKGWRPGRAPIGYKNDKGGEQGSKIIHVDDDKFPLVRKMWDFMLTGNYSVTKIVDIANNEWGLRTSSKNRELKLCDRHGYKIFTNPFYYGSFEFCGKVYQGQHKVMVTPEEFDHVQRLLGVKAKPQTRHKNLPYRGLLRCGECGCYITTEIKTKMIKSKGKLQSYIYHHCTHRKTEVKCRQMPAAHEDINKQVLEILDRITLPQSFLTLALEILSRENVVESANRGIVVKNQQKALNDCTSKIDNLIKLYISPTNQNKELISDEEFKGQKTALIKEKAGIQQQLENLDKQADEWMDLTEQTFKFAVYARHEFTTGDYETKTNILKALGKNFILKDGKVTVELKKQYQLIEDGRKMITLENPRLELDSFALGKTKTTQFKAVFDTLSG
ncbi:MAG: recombinase family protein [Patescibacteria group bacterium]